MAITISDLVLTKYGFSLTDLYVTLDGSYRVDKQSDGTYTAEALAKYYANTAQHTANNQMEAKLITSVVSVTDLSSNIMTLLYNQLKSNYTVTVDV
jgi:hypothetical protein